LSSEFAKKCSHTLRTLISKATAEVWCSLELSPCFPTSSARNAIVHFMDNWFCFPTMCNSYVQYVTDWLTM